MNSKRLAVTMIVAGLTGFAQSSKDWPTYGHDAGGMRFSPLTQLTSKNVSQLKVAWVYHMKPAGGAAPLAPARPGAGRSEGDTPGRRRPARPRPGAQRGRFPGDRSHSAGH